jgi:hypothetical protein
MSLAQPAAVALLLVLPLAAQAQGVALERDLQFARALARELRFFDLAERELERLEDRHPQTEARARVQLAGIEVAWLAARARSDAQDRRGRYLTALQRAEDLARADQKATGDRAQLSAIEIGYELVQLLVEAQAETADPQEGQRLANEAQGLCKRGIDICEQALRRHAERKETDARSRLDYHLVWLFHGRFLRELGRVAPEQRKASCQRAREVLEELVLAVGEDTALGQRALFEIAGIFLVLGEHDEAATRFSELVRTAIAALSDAARDVDADVRALTIALVGETYALWTQALLAQARPADALRRAAEFRDGLLRLQVKPTRFAPAVTAGDEDPRFGHVVWLVEAQALAAAGDAASLRGAFDRARFVSERHRDDALGRRAHALLVTLLRRDDLRVAGSAPLLLELAQQSLERREFAAAEEAAARAIARMDAAERGQLLLRAALLRGKCLALLERFQDATLQLQQGLEAARVGGAEAAEAAELLLRTLRRWRAAGDGAAAAAAEGLEALARRFLPVTGGELRAWVQANEAMAAQRWREAAQLYEQVPASAPQHEIARARAVAAWHQVPDLERARRLLAEYRAWLDSPAAQLDPARADLLQSRAIAIAELDFTTALLRFEAATGTGHSQTQDRTQLPEVVTLLVDYLARHAQVAPAQAAQATYLLGRAHVELGELLQAEERYRELKRLAPGDALVPRLASAVFVGYHERIRAQTATVRQLERAGSAAALPAERARANELRRAALLLGADYVQLSASPQLGIVQSALECGEALRAWPTVKDLGEQALRKLDGDPQGKARAERVVLPFVAQALLMQRKYRQAHDLVTPAAEGGAAPELERLRALALGGFVELTEAGAFEEHPGLSQPKAAFELYWNGYRPHALHPDRAGRYCLDWYRCHWEAYWLARAQAAAGDSVGLERSRALYATARSTDDFATLKELPGGREWYDRFLHYQPR